jgi:hypothetical protein
MAQRILKNNTAAIVPIPDTGFSVPASGQLVIDPTQYGKFEGSSDVIVEIGASVLTVNDGTFDLSITEGTRLIQGGFSRPISDGQDPTIKMGVTDATGTTDYDLRARMEAVLGGLDALAAFRRVNTKVRSDGLNALATDATVVVESTFGFDQQPDSFFRIINTGGAGTTWTLDIAGTNNDPSTPDRDVPAYQKIFTVQVAEEGDEIEFRDRIISELNQDPVFKDTVFFKAQRATDRAIVHIYSTAFSASGEFYERPSAGDFAVTIGGVPGDGVVVVGFDNVVSRSKPVTITRDFDSPHRLGLFGITGDVNVTSKALSDLFIERASLDGLGVDFDMDVNGSVTEQIFRINAKIDSAVFIQEIRFYGQGNGIKFGNFLNLNGTLTNGVLVEIKSENTITDLFDIKSTEDFKNEFSYPSAAAFEVIFASGRDEFLATFVFQNPFLLEESGAHGAGNDDYIEVRIRDNLTQVGSMRFLAKGFEKEP